MSHRILQLEAERRSARLVRDQAHRELRTLKTKTPKDIQKLATTLLADLRKQSRERRSRPFDTKDDFLRWLAVASTDIEARLQSVEGDTGNLALAELRLMVANDRVCVINRELTRLLGERSGWVNNTRRNDSGLAPGTRLRTSAVAG